MAKSDEVALTMVFLGLLIGIAFVFALPADKLTISLPVPVSLIGAGLSKWKGD